ncbi:hypothetical protein LXL04_029035 [Taraxacum kok-saghyz]
MFLPGGELCTAREQVGCCSSWELWAVVLNDGRERSSPEEDDRGGRRGAEGEDAGFAEFRILFLIRSLQPPDYISKRVMLESAYFAGVVIDRSPGMRKVRFETLLNDDGTPLEESVSMRRLRLCPPKVDARFTVGDIVDAWHNDGWWSARYIRRDGDNYVVRFDNMDPPNETGSYPRRHIRFHHEWSVITNRSNETANCWMLICLNVFRIMLLNNACTVVIRTFL